jgi:hypothetical protein
MVQIIPAREISLYELEEKFSLQVVTTIGDRIALR